MKHSYNFIVKQATVSQLKEVAELALKFWRNQPSSQVFPSVRRLTKQLVSEIEASKRAIACGYEDVKCWGVKEMLYIAYNQKKPAYFGQYSDIEATYEGVPVKFEVKSSSPNREGVVLRQMKPQQTQSYIKRGVYAVIWVDFETYLEDSKVTVKGLYPLEKVAKLPMSPNYRGDLCHDLNTFGE